LVTDVVTLRIKMALYDYLYIFWLPYTIIAIPFFYCFLRYHKHYEKQITIKQPSYSPRIVFQIVTKGKSIDLVQRNVDIINKISKEIGYRNYEIWVVTDGKEKYSNAETINVPDDFTCKFARYKARALQYAVNKRRNLKLKLKLKVKDLNELWVLHLDEDSEVTKDLIVNIINFIEKGNGNGNGKLIAEGGINYPNRFFDSQFLIPSLIGGEISFSCYFCCMQMEHTPIWLHGSNLLVRADLEEEIGWDYSTIAEDQNFGYQVAIKKGNIFAWHGGTLLEQPPFTIIDMLKQRRRWFHGSIQNLKFLNIKKKIIQLTFLNAWVFGFFANLVGILSLFKYIYTPEFLKPLFIFNLFVWVLMYQWGTYLNIRHIQNLSIIKKIFVHLYCLLITPVLGFFSTLSAIYAIILPPKSFDVTSKTIIN
jgi:cellulose synthase/poly-beta-1,6-N-acetylglucosamine synthase-like glycosyltransferase